MTELFSLRFNKRIAVTRHAGQRMHERNVDDNLLCAVLVLEDCVVVKTVMHHFDLS